MRLKLFLLVSLILTSIFWPFLFGLGLVIGVASIADSTEVTSEVDEYSYHWGTEDSDTKILSIPINGPILDERPDQFGSFDPFITTFATFGVETKELLYEVANDDSIDGIILEINSPGGTVTGSKAITDGVAYYKQVTNKPVYAFASGLMASGSYWAGISADRVLVETGSLVGSIGVIGGQFATYTNVSEMNQGLIGPGVTADSIAVTTITSGEGKDFGNPFRAPSEKELSIAQQSTDQIYDIFTSYVASKRNVSQETIINDIGAYVYGEQQAMSLNLIDEVGSREYSYASLAQKITSEDFEVVRKIDNESLWGSIFGVVSNISHITTETNSSPQTCIYTHRAMVYFGNTVELCK